MKSTKNELPKNYFAIAKRIIGFLGFSMTPNSNMLYNAYTFVIVTLMVTYFFLMIPNFINPKENFDEIINNLLFDTGFAMMIVEIVTLILNRTKLNTLLNTLEKGVFAPNFKRGGELEQILIKNCIDLTRKQTIIGASLGFACIFACITASLLMPQSDGQIKLPFGSLAILHKFDYKISFVFQSLVFGFGITSFIVINSIYASVLAHISVQCKILQNSIRRTGKKEFLKTSSTSEERLGKLPRVYLQKAIKEVVLYHMAIIEIAAETEDIFNIPTLIVFIGMSICSCFIMYHGSLYSFSDFYFLKDLVTLIGSMLPLCINCYLGNKVMIESTLIADACYEIDFVVTDLQFQKSLLLIMTRSQKPIVVTVGKFTALSLSTMLGLFRASYSYFMLLRKVNEN